MTKIKDRRSPVLAYFLFRKISIFYVKHEASVFYFCHLNSLPKTTFLIIYQFNIIQHPHVATVPSLSPFFASPD